MTQQIVAKFFLHGNAGKGAYLRLFTVITHESGYAAGIPKGANKRIRGLVYPLKHAIFGGNRNLYLL